MSRRGFMGAWTQKAIIDTLRRYGPPPVKVGLETRVERALARHRARKEQSNGHTGAC